jgi:hypothetical protein
VNVEEMNDFSRRNFKVATDTATGFTPGSRKIVNANFAHGETAENDVAVDGATQLSRLTNAIVVTDGVSKVLRLVLLFAPAFQAHYFLQGDDVCLKLIQDFSNSGRTYASINAAAFVSVIRGYSKTWLFFHCCNRL